MEGLSRYCMFRRIFSSALVNPDPCQRVHKCLYFAKFKVSQLVRIICYAMVLGRRYFELRMRLFSYKDEIARECSFTEYS